MNLDMWFRDDIACLLSSALQAGQFMAGEGGDFQRGYAAAVSVMARNFHLTPRELQFPERIDPGAYKVEAVQHGLTPSGGRR